MFDNHACMDGYGIDPVFRDYDLFRAQRFRREKLRFRVRDFLIRFFSILRSHVEGHLGDDVSWRLSYKSSMLLKLGCPEGSHQDSTG